MEYLLLEAVNNLAKEYDLPVYMAEFGIELGIGYCYRSNMPGMLLSFDRALIINNDGGSLVSKEVMIGEPSRIKIVRYAIKYLEDARYARDLDILRDELKKADGCLVWKVEANLESILHLSVKLKDSLPHFKTTLHSSLFRYASVNREYRLETIIQPNGHLLLLPESTKTMKGIVSEIFKKCPHPVLRKTNFNVCKNSDTTFTLVTATYLSPKRLEFAIMWLEKILDVKELFKFK